MTVISSKTISKRLSDPDDHLNITPIFDWKKQISGASVDLRLDNQFIVTSRTSFAGINPIHRKEKEIESIINQYQKKIKIPYGEKFVLHPDELIIGSTLEFLSFPKDLMAYVIGRSSWGRLGLIIATATTINPCFKGNLTLELVNTGNIPIELYPGVRIAQLVIHKIKGEEDHEGKYQLQIGPGFSKIYEDTELEYLLSHKYKIIIGLTGHKGSGKSIFSSYLIEDKLYKYFSLSHIVRNSFKEKEVSSPEREHLHNHGDFLRYRNKKADYLTRLVIRELRNSDVDSETAIVIDGIRNPKEIDLLEKLPNFHLIGIKTEKEKINKNLQNKGYLLKDSDYKALKTQVDKETKISMSKFNEAYKRDCGQGGTIEDREGYGQNIEACLKKCKPKNLLRISVVTKVIDALNDFKKIIGNLEQT